MLIGRVNAAQNPIDLRLENSVAVTASQLGTFLNVPQAGTTSGATALIRRGNLPPYLRRIKEVRQDVLDIKPRGETTAVTLSTALAEIYFSLMAVFHFDKPDSGLILPAFFTQHFYSPLSARLHYEQKHSPDEASPEDVLPFFDPRRLLLDNTPHKLRLSAVDYPKICQSGQEIVHLPLCEAPADLAKELQGVLPHILNLHPPDADVAPASPSAFYNITAL